MSCSAYCPLTVVQCLLNYFFFEIARGDDREPFGVEVLAERGVRRSRASMP